jgi:hypothetical protein
MASLVKACCRCLLEEEGAIEPIDASEENHEDDQQNLMRVDVERLHIEPPPGFIEEACTSLASPATSPSMTSHMGLIMHAFSPSEGGLKEEEAQEEEQLSTDEEAEELRVMLW